MVLASVTVVFKTLGLALGPRTWFFGDDMGFEVLSVANVDRKARRDSFFNRTAAILSSPRFSNHTFASVTFT